MAASCSAEACMSGMALLCNTDYIFECLARLWIIVSKTCYLHPTEGWKELLRPERKISSLHLFMGRSSDELFIFEEMFQCWTAVMFPSAHLPLPPWVLYLPLRLSCGRTKAALGAWIPTSESRHWTHLLPCGHVSRSSGGGWMLDIRALLLGK